MTVRAIETQSSIEKLYIGLSSDAKPTTVPVGSQFYEYDTKCTYITYNGLNWVPYASESSGINGIQVGTDQSFLFSNSAPASTTVLVTIPKPDVLVDIYDLVIKNLSDVTALTVNLFNKIAAFPTYVAYKKLPVSLSIPASSLGAINKCLSYNAGTTNYTDETTDINSATANDVVAPPIAQLGDRIFIGDDIPFTGARLNVGTAGVYTATLVWEYWNGTDWATLTLTDDTNGFKVAGKKDIKFNEPIDWVANEINATSKYWISARCSAFTSVTTAPLITQAWIIGARGSMTYSNLVRDLFLNGDLVLAISNDTVLGASDGFSGYVRLEKYK